MMNHRATFDGRPTMIPRMRSMNPGNQEIDCNNEQNSSKRVQHAVPDLTDCLVISGE